MRNTFLLTCLLLSSFVFAQHKNIKKDGVYVPSSIFAINSIIFNQNISDLNITYIADYKFLMADFNNPNISNNLQINFRNIGRKPSVEDQIYNFEQARLNRYNVTKNANHFIWNTHHSKLVNN